MGPNLSAWALSSRSFVLFLMAVAVVAGVVSFGRLGRGEDPAFTFRTMVVSAGWPGATLDETLSQVTERLERRLQEVPDLDFMRSQTTAGRTVIFVNLLGSAGPDAVSEAWYQVRKKIGDIRGTLPAGVVGPGFNDEFGDTFGVIYGFTAADGFTHRELRDAVEDARSRLLTVPDVSKIELIGTQDERIFLEFSPEALAGLGLDRGALVAALAAQNVVLPAGVVQTGAEALSVRVSGSFRSEDDLREVTFAVGGRMVRLADIAEVRRGVVDPPQPIFRVNGRQAIGLAIAMRDGGDVLALGENVRAAMAGITADLPIGIEPTLVSDQPAIVDEAIGDFMESLWQAIVIILGCSLLALGLRAGAVVALAIPLVLAVTLAVMLTAGIDLHRISLGALIIALALMVDDAMTMTDSMLRRAALGETLPQAAAGSYASLSAPMLVGTLVTIAGFLPIGFAASSAGEYTFSIFAVVGIALLVSWLVAVLFAPLIALAVLPKGAPKTDGPPREGAVLRGYKALLRAALTARWVTILVAAGLFAAALFAVRFVPQQFFPSSDRLELVVEMRLPQNASVQATEDLTARLDAILAADPDVERFSTYVGRGAIRFYLPLNAQLANPFLSETVVIARDLDARRRLEARLYDTIRERFPSVVSRISPLELGPPVGWPVQYRVTGPDLEGVRTQALRLAEVVAADVGARDVNFDWMEAARELRIRVDQEQARLLGLSSAAVAQSLASAASGAVVTQVRDDIYLVDVVARANDAERLSIDTLRNLQVPVAGGRAVSLSAFATFEYGQEQPIVWRRDRVPTLTVQADVVPGTLPDEVTTRLAPAVAAFAAGLPRGYRVETGGVVEESARSRASVLAVVPVMLLITLTLLMAQLRSFRRLAVVLAVIPLGLIGVVAALLLSGRPMGFVALLGILSLLGMIAKNAVILIDQIEIERAAGRPVREAVVEAAASRMRPIVLTAVSTVLGMIPIAFTVFWGPMAFAIMGGLLAATLLTLVFLPAMYLVWFGRSDRPPAEAPPAEPAGWTAPPPPREDGSGEPRAIRTPQPVGAGEA